MFIVILLSKIITFFLRLLRLGGGTALPGLIFEKYFPESLSKLTSNYKKIIFITGTNGKTTTQQLLRHLLEFKKVHVASNISGANIFRGIAAAIVSDCNVFGKAKSDIAVFEVEEATMPIITKIISPDYIIVTSLYRDQLDAYGEILQTREYILESIKQVPEAKIVLNGDDKNLSSIASEVKNKVVLFSIKDKRKDEIFYEKPHFKFKGRKNIKKVYAKDISIENDLSTRFSLYGFKVPIKDLHFNSPGIQNIYNAVAACFIAKKIVRFGKSEIKAALSSFNPAFGRGEIIRINGKQVRLLLIKNPASFTANINMLKNVGALKLMILINDNIADGRDISWLWDSNIELLQKSNIAWITISGIRASDMLLRLKYANINSLSTEIEPNISKALGISLAKLRDGEMLFILPTYTAMLEVRKAIGSIVKVKEFWK
jgi:UDP-N-acetylmuramyl tripeptide synthase